MPAVHYGDFALVEDIQKIYVRVIAGWQSVILGDSIPKYDEDTTTTSTIKMTTVETKKSNNRCSRGKPHLKLIALIRAVNPTNVKNIKQYDKYCQKLARNSKLSRRGRFQAMLSSKTRDIKNLVNARHQKLPICNIRDDLLSENWSEFINSEGNINNGIVYSFTGIDIRRFKSKIIWHGSFSNGTRSKDTCNDWNAADQTKAGKYSSYPGNIIGDVKRRSCDSKGIILCIRTRWSKRNKSPHKKRKP